MIRVNKKIAPGGGPGANKQKEKNCVCLPKRYRKTGHFVNGKPVLLTEKLPYYNLPLNLAGAFVNLEDFGITH